jgi:hypothetical protein
MQKAKLYETGVNFVINHLSASCDQYSFDHIWKLVTAAAVMQKQHNESVAAKKAADPVTLSVGAAATGPQEAILPPWLLPNTLAEYIMPVIERQDATGLDAAWRSESGLVIAELMNNFAQWIKETKLSLADFSSIEMVGGSNVGG